MFGVNAAQAGVTKTAAMIAQQMAKTLPQKALTKGAMVKSWEVVYLPSAETMRVTPDQGPSRA